MTLTTDATVKATAGFAPGHRAVGPQAGQELSASLGSEHSLGTDASTVALSASLRTAPAQVAASGTSQIPDIPTESVAESTLGIAPGDWTTATVPARQVRRTWGQRYGRRIMVTDAVALAVAALGVHLIEVPSLPTAVSASPSFPPFIALSAAFAIAWMVVLSWSGSRDGKVTGHGHIEYKRVIQASLSLFGLVAIVSFMLQLDLPRSYWVIMLPVGLAALLVSRYLWRRWLHRQRDAGSYMSNVIAVGDRHTVTELLQDLDRAPRAGYRVVGVCIAPDAVSSGTDLTDDMVGGVPVLGSLKEVAAVAISSGADAVAVTSSTAFGPSAVRRLSWELEDTDAELILAPALTNIAGPRVHTQPVAGLPLIHVDRPTYRGANRILKKSFDIIGSSLLLLLFSPVLLTVAIAIKLTSKGPVFFRQERVGINGEIFRMIKFRSMVVDAESRLEKLQNDERDAGNVVLFKMKNDPRITKIGKFIRRFSIDEVPQLMNVLSGDMSLVGPRPPLAREVALYGDDARRRLLVKPGMTGLWQVSGRSDLTWDDSVRLDVYYVENWSITADLSILWRTARAVFSSSGAY